MKHRIYALILGLMTLISCGGNPDAWDSNSQQSWYQSWTDLDPEKVDVFYLVSTEVISASDENGNISLQSQLMAEDVEAMRGEISWVENNMFFGRFNLIAPYYHQLTFNALTLPGGNDFEEAWHKVSEEVCDAFDYYMDHQNGGRPFIIAGFSQGAMLTLELLEHMSDRQYSGMIACYALGYRLSAEDLSHPHINAASGASDTGVVISFNSTMTREAIWPLVSADAVTCINPLNWKTDSTPASFEFDGTFNTVHVDQAANVLLVDTDTPSYYHSFYEKAPFFLDTGVDKDNLHHWDLLFYPGQIHDNALLRADSFVAD